MFISTEAGRGALNNHTHNLGFCIFSAYVYGPPTESEDDHRYVNIYNLN